MEIKTFIEKAIEGGWASHIVVNKHYWEASNAGLQWYASHPARLGAEILKVGIHEILLDPKAWEAVGNTQAWEKECDKCGKQSEDIQKEGKIYGGSICSYMGEAHKMQPYWKYYMRRMINALAQGKTVTEYLEIL